MAGSNGQVTQVVKSASAPPAYAVTIAYPASPGPPPVAAYDETYIIDAVDFGALSPHVGCACKVDATGPNGGAIGNYAVKK